VDSIETVKVVKAHAPGYAIINKSDFDPERHELFGVKSDGKADLVAQALELGLESKSILERWSVERLKIAIAKAGDKS
jgi:hypothetical protein